MKQISSKNSKFSKSFEDKVDLVADSEFVVMKEQLRYLLRLIGDYRNNGNNHIMQKLKERERINLNDVHSIT